MPRLWEIIDALPDGKRPRLIRGDVGYGGDDNLCEAERRGLKYLFKLRRTKTVLALSGGTKTLKDGAMQKTDGKRWKA